MGVKYALSAMVEEVPNYVDGLRHWIEWQQTEEEASLSVVVRFWEDTAELGRLTVVIGHGTITTHGGTHENWDDLCAAGANSSDTDDVINLVTTSVWGVSLLWSCWRAHLGRLAR